MWERARVVGGGSSFVMCPTTAPDVTQLSVPNRRNPSMAPTQLEVPKASRRRFSAVFDRPASPSLLDDYRDASGRVGLARSSVRRCCSDDIHILHLFLREPPATVCRSGISLFDTTMEASR